MLVMNFSFRFLSKLKKTILTHEEFYKKKLIIKNPTLQEDFILKYLLFFQIFPKVFTKQLSIHYQVISLTVQLKTFCYTVKKKKTQN